MGTFLLIPASAGGLNSVATFGDLPATASLGDAYLVRDTGVIYFWDSGASWEATDAQLAPASAADTNSIDTTITSGVLTADLKLSSNAASSGYLKATSTIKTTGSTGLHVEIPEASAGQTGVLRSADFSTFAGKQAGDADLTAISALTGPGFAAKTTTDPTAPAWANRTISGTSNRIGVSNGDGVGGNPTINLDTTQFPQAVVADIGKALVATAANTATYSEPASITDACATGLVSWGGSGNYYSYGSGTFTVLRSGVGRKCGEKITWAGGESVSGLVANKGYLIGFSATNTLTAIDISTVVSSNKVTQLDNFAAAYTNNVILFGIWTDGANPKIVKEDHSYKHTSDISIHEHVRLGQTFTYGGGLLSVLNAASRTIQTSGEDMLDDHGLVTRIPDAAGSALYAEAIFQNAGGIAQAMNRRQFTVSGISVSPTAGAVYSNNGSQFTVNYTTLTGSAPNISGTISAWTSSGNNNPQVSGTLTKVSGTGDATISFSSYLIPTSITSSYAPAGVPTNLSSAGATRYGIVAVYVSKDDLQTPSTAAPAPTYFQVLSNTAYNSSSSAANSIGTGSFPDLTQFKMPNEMMAIELVLNGFVLLDGNGRTIPAVSTNGFVNGVRTNKAAIGSVVTAGSVTATTAVNVSTDTSAFAGWLSSADANVQLALNSIAAKSSAIRTVTTDPTITTNDRTILCDCTGAQITVNLPAAATNLGRMMWIKKIDSSANKVVIEGNASETIDGALNQELISQFKSVQIQCDGSNWYILSSVWG